MAISLGDYRNLERCRRLDFEDLRSATFAAFRIAITRDGHADSGTSALFCALEDLLDLFEAAERLRTFH
jgi:hypothetical protein